MPPRSFLMRDTNLVTTAEGTAGLVQRILTLRNVTLEAIEWQIAYRCSHGKIELVKGRHPDAVAAAAGGSEIDLVTGFSRIAGQDILWQGRLDLFGDWTILFSAWGVPAATRVHMKAFGVSH